jgi:hypothetical protein
MRRRCLPSSILAPEHITASSPMLEHTTASTQASDQAAAILFLKP